MEILVLRPDTARSEKRPLPDSNRGWRICNPLPYRLAKGPKDCVDNDLEQINPTRWHQNRHHRCGIARRSRPRAAHCDAGQAPRICSPRHRSVDIVGRLVRPSNAGFRLTV
jgi:hypothetical protein